MNRTDFQSFAKIMAGLGELYSKQVSDALMDIYWNSLSSWTIDEFKLASSQLVQTCTFMPKPSDFFALRK